MRRSGAGWRISKGTDVEIVDNKVEIKEVGGEEEEKLFSKTWKKKSLMIGWLIDILVIKEMS